VSIKNLEELVAVYDKLRSFANSGSHDKWAASRLKIRRLLRWKLFQRFSVYTYDLPFAANQIRNEIRNTLIRILKLYEINYLRTGKTDDVSGQAIDVIKKYLENIPKRDPSLLKRLKNNVISILGVSTGILALILSIRPSDLQIVLLILGLLLFAPSILFICDVVFVYATERHWYLLWMKRLGISELKDKIINELVTLNDKTYEESESKYKS